MNRRCDTLPAGPLKHISSLLRHASPDVVYLRRHAARVAALLRLWRAHLWRAVLLPGTQLKHVDVEAALLGGAAAGGGGCGAHHARLAYLAGAPRPRRQHRAAARSAHRRCAAARPLRCGARVRTRPPARGALSPGTRPRGERLLRYALRARAAAAMHLPSQPVHRQTDAPPRRCSARAARAP
jgi:hypothetical protein